jgi:hypothetical protein
MYHRNATVSQLLTGLGAVILGVTALSYESRRDAAFIIGAVIFVAGVTRAFKSGPNCKHESDQANS